MCPPSSPSGHTAQWLEAFSDPLDRLAVENDSLELPQTRRRDPSSLGREHFSQRGTAIREKRLAQADIQPPQLAVHGGNRCRQFARLQSSRKDAEPAATRLQQRVANQLHHLRKREHALITASPMFVEQLIQEFRVVTCCNNRNAASANGSAATNSAVLVASMLGILARRKITSATEPSRIP